MSYPVLTALRPASIGAATNGHITADVLINVGGASVRLLAPEAAACWLELCEACHQATGIRPVVLGGGAYRTYQQQVDLFKQRYVRVLMSVRADRVWNGQGYKLKPGNAAAATPGTSNHGLGAAVDMAEPIIDAETGRQIGTLGISSSRAWSWLLEHAVSFGWSWELQSEPWHLRLVAAPEPVAVIWSAPITTTTMSRGQPMYVRDNRAEGWEIWCINRDWSDAVYTYPIGDMPGRGDWDVLGPVIEAAYGPIPVVDFNLLLSLMGRRNRPTVRAS